MFLRHCGPKFERRLQWKKFKNLLKKRELKCNCILHQPALWYEYSILYPWMSFALEFKSWEINIYIHMYVVICNRSINSSLQSEWHRFMWASSWIFYNVFLYVFLSYTYVYFIYLVLASFLRFTMLKYMIFIMSEKDSIFKSYQLKFVVHHEYSYKKFDTFWYSN